MTRPRLVAAPDKFRGTATATELAAAIAACGRNAQWDVTSVPVSDGGEGLLECFGGGNRTTTVTGPLGASIEARWRLDGDRAVIALAEASGLALVDGDNDPVAATTQGMGELIATAIEAGARDIVVGVGGSATTDGGLGAIEVLKRFAPLDGTQGVRVVVAADVSTRFVDAARVFAPQKGATPQEVVALTARLDALAVLYREQYRVDVTTLPGSGAAGGASGGLAALGASIRPGFDVVAHELQLPGLLAGADLVVTGEGRLDDTSLLGKAPIGVARLAADSGVECLLIAGSVSDRFELDRLPVGVHVVSLASRFGAHTARTSTVACVRSIVQDALAQHRA